MSTLELVIAIVSTGATTQFANIIFNYKKNKALSQKEQAQAIGSELDNVEKAVTIWRQLSEEQTSRVTLMELEITELKNTVRNIEEMYRKKCDGCKYKKFYYETHPEREGI
jgi:DNA-directed RNA polymerase subunit M/transcription elongation factor TFIIS